ncbi:MAG: GNAT family N-acetyltransferase [Thiohalocapsa sp.]
MEEHLNALGQPVGASLPDWSPRPLPPRTPMPGRSCTVRPLDPARDPPPLFAAFAEDQDGRMWTYLPREGYRTLEELQRWADSACLTDDPLVHTIVDHASGEAVGTANYMRIEPAHGVIEVGSITYSPRLQRRTAATEAMYLMMRRVFDELGYRRYEWKCNSLNAPSRAAATRLGFRYEGLFRQAQVVKGQNRDTAWFSIVDSEWPALRAAFEAWLDPANFTADGTQRRSLASFRSASS